MTRRRIDHDDGLVLAGRPPPVERPGPGRPASAAADASAVASMQRLQGLVGNAALQRALLAGGPRNAGSRAAVQRTLVPLALRGATGGWTVHAVTCKRDHIDLGRGRMGHWWTELGPDESYGWWPKGSGTAWDALVGTTGELNAVSSDIGGTPTRDPYHGTGAEESFHPVCTTDRTPAEVIAAMRAFARSYRGSWRWSFLGTDCHTFQTKMLEAAGCHPPTPADLERERQLAATDPPGRDADPAGRSPTAPA